MLWTFLINANVWNKIAKKTFLQYMTRLLLNLLATPALFYELWWLAVANWLYFILFMWVVKYLADYEFHSCKLKKKKPKPLISAAVRMYEKFKSFVVNSLESVMYFVYKSSILYEWGWMMLIWFNLFLLYSI